MFSAQRCKLEDWNGGIELSVKGGAVDTAIIFSGAQGRGEHIATAQRCGCDQNADIDLVAN